MLKNRISGMRVGYGMIARGEVAFITIGIGLAYGVLTEQIYSTMVVVIIATIIIAPTLLRRSYTNSIKNN
jgi:Kef-type K+ transport system membrane component KefB